MRIRGRLKAENKKKESSTCEVINTDNGQCVKQVDEFCSWIGKKKRYKPRKRRSNGIKLDNEMAIIINDSLLVGNSSACLTDDDKSRPNPVIGPSSKRNRKNNMEIIKEAVQSEMEANGVSLSGYVNEAMKECKMLSSSESMSSDISGDLEARCNSPVLTSKNVYLPIQSDERSLSIDNVKVDINFMQKCDKDDGKRSTDVSSEMEIEKIGEARGVKTYARRKTNVCDSSKIDSNSIQEDSSLQHTGHSRTGNISSGISCETVSGGCSKDVDKKILVEGEGSQYRVLEDVQVDRVFDGCADRECTVGENEGRMDVNNLTEKTTEGCFNMDKPLVANLEDIIESSKSENLNDVAEAGEPRISLEDKACDDECPKITPEGPVDTSIMHVSDSSNSRDDTSQVNEVSPGRSLIASSRKKLLVLDLNGLIAEIIRYVPERHTPDGVVSRKAVFKRPFYEDFLQFCFARFSVGVWSSRAKVNVQSVVDFLLGDAKQNLLFCWDQSHCTETGFYTVENRNKPLLVKKLQKLWEKCEPELPWKLGEYNEANTLMLDDSPYKALLNPPHTAIFPPSYRHTNKNDDALGPGGALRIYLEGLASAEDVQKYVKENPFGQRPITEKNASWRFYQMVIEAILRAPGSSHGKCSTSEPDWDHGIQSGKGDLNSSSKTLDECPHTHEQRASSSPHRHRLCGTDRPHWRRGPERRGGDWNSDYNPRRSSGYHDRCRFGDPNRQDYGSRIRSRGNDWNQGYREQDKCPVSDDQEDCGYSSFDTKGSSHWSRGIQGGHGDWNRGSRDLDKSLVSYDQKGSRYSGGYSSFDAPRSERSWRIHRGGGDWNRTYQPLDQRPVSLDQRVSGYSYGNRYPRASFHWQAYR